MEEGRTTVYKIRSSEDREMDVSGTVRAALEQAVMPLSLRCLVCFVIPPVVWKMTPR
jgi:hypothetical protein